jgi:hypothetical protein
MTIPRNTAIRIVASSLCFDQDPAPIKNLERARQAASSIVDALELAGMLDVTPGTANGGQPVVLSAVSDQDPLPGTE